MKSKVSYVLEYLVGVMFLLSMGFCSYVLFFPFKVLTPETAILPLNKQTYIGGDVLSYRVESCKLIDLQGEISYQLIGDTTYLLPSGLKSNVPVGCRKSEPRNAVLPKGIIPGKYKLVIHIRYIFWNIRNVDYTYFTEEFTVKKEKIE